MTLGTRSPASTSTPSTSWRRRNAGGARRFAASSLEESFNTTDDILVSEAAKGKRRPAPEHVLRPAGPLDVAGVQGLCGDVRPVRVKRVEQVGIRHSGSKYLLGQGPIQMDEMRADRRVEVGHAARKPAHALAWVDRAREGERSPIEAVQTELGAKRAERFERDPAVGRELAARHAQHPCRTPKENGLAAGAGRCAVAHREDAQAREGGADRFRPE